MTQGFCSVQRADTCNWYYTHSPARTVSALYPARMADSFPAAPDNGTARPYFLHFSYFVPHFPMRSPESVPSPGSVCRSLLYQWHSAQYFSHLSPNYSSHFQTYPSLLTLSPHPIFCVPIFYLKLCSFHSLKLYMKESKKATELLLQFTR